jgi:hypothetical protein
MQEPESAREARVANWLLVMAPIAAFAGCSSPTDAAQIVREGSPWQIALYVLLLPVFAIADALFRDFIRALIPSWMKTRRVVWTGVAVLAAITAGALVYWGRASPRQ